MDVFVQICCIIILMLTVAYGLSSGVLIFHAIRDLKKTDGIGTEISKAENDNPKSEYIDVTKLTYRDRYGAHNTDGISNYVTEDDIKQIPKANVRENIFSSWDVKRDENGFPQLYCKHCGAIYKTGVEHKNFCGNCGALMRNKEV